MKASELFAALEQGKCIGQLNKTHRGSRWFWITSQVTKTGRTQYTQHGWCCKLHFIENWLKDIAINPDAWTIGTEVDGEFVPAIQD